MLEFCELNTPGIKSIKLLNADVIAHTKEVSTRFEQAKQFRGLQNFTVLSLCLNISQLYSKSAFKLTYQNWLNVTDTGEQREELILILIFKSKIMYVALMMMRSIIESEEHVETILLSLRP